MRESSCPSCGGFVGDDTVLNGLCTACLLSVSVDDQGSADPQALSPGATLGPYEIVEPLGRGGMGRVYLGWDGRLCRTVAIKVLAAAVTADDERTRRLEREARIVAGLDHPRICGVYDIGRDQGLTYVVMEHLDGQTLAARLQAGRLPIAEVLRYAIEIADGLDCAHRHGVTHRDLKPANIMLTKTGVRLLDFGLAARGEARGGPETPGSRHMSTLGGTIRYMAPEQLDATIADVRSDVFSFGLVLYEMLTAQPAFAAGTRDELIAAVSAARVPAAAAMRHDVPVAIDRIIQRCTRKDPEERWQSLRDVSYELRHALDDLTSAPSQASPQRSRRLQFVAGGLLFTALVTAPLVSALASRTAEPAPAVRFAAVSPRPVSEFSGVGDMAFVSPDGRSLVWVSVVGDGKTVLYVQRLDSSSATMLAGTDNATWPFWSPDSRTIAYFAGGELRTVPSGGGAPQAIAKAALKGGGSWTRRGTILFAPSLTGPIYEVDERGGEPRPVTTVDASAGELAHLWPVYLDDGSFIYLSTNRDPERRGLYHRSAASATAQWLGRADGGAAWAPPGHLLFTRAGMLIAQRFDRNAVKLIGEPRMLQPRVCSGAAILGPCFSASASGVLVYHIARLARSQFAWFSRTGRQTDVPVEAGSFYNPVLSSDAQRIAVERHDPKSWQLGIWQFHLDKQMLSRVIDTPMQAGTPVWSPDGRSLAFAGSGERGYGIFTAPIDGGAIRQLLSWAHHVVVADWSGDSRRLLFEVRGQGTGDDIWVLPLDSPQSAAPYLQSRFNERQARFSPDGRWIMYAADDTGRSEVYVQPFPPNGAKFQVSTEGGQQPLWRRDGREVFYLSLDRRLMAASVQLGGDPRVGKPVELFRVPPDAPKAHRISYAPSADGQRFLFTVAARDRERLPQFQAEVLVNWTTTLHE